MPGPAAGSAKALDRMPDVLSGHRPPGGRDGAGCGSRSRKSGSAETRGRRAVGPAFSEVADPGEIHTIRRNDDGRSGPDRTVRTYRTSGDGRDISPLPSGPVRTLEKIQLTERGNAPAFSKTKKSKDVHRHLNKRQTGDIMPDMPSGCGEHRITGTENHGRDDRTGT